MDMTTIGGRRTRIRLDSGVVMIDNLSWIPRAVEDAQGATT